jgi:hypothetical protein
MCWSSLYADQFAVGYGSFHYQRQGTGAISIFSLKNPSHAEITITTESGVHASMKDLKRSSGTCVHANEMRTLCALRRLERHHALGTSTAAVVYTLLTADVTGRKSCHLPSC